MRDDSRYAIGLANLQKIDGQAGEAVIQSLAEICPDLGRYIIEYPFGDIYERQSLDLKQRELITIAMLATMGNAAPQLAVHVNGALNVGCQPAEIIETVLQVSVYAGFPAAINAMLVVKTVFAERNISLNEDKDS